MNDRRILVCDCGGSMQLDGIDGLKVARELCRSDIATYRTALTEGSPIVVACRQEMRLFEEVRIDTAPECPVTYIDIRDRGGWSDQAASAGPKIAALLAEAAIDIPPVPAVSFSSEGVAVVLGRDEEALAAARKIADRLSVGVILKDPRELMLTGLNAAPFHAGRVVKASGHLGAFTLVVDDHAAHIPSGRGAATFGRPAKGAVIHCDIIIDLTGDAPLFQDHWRRDGYVRRDPGDPSAVQDGLLHATTLIGAFEKPRYVSVRAETCAHTRNQKTGCTRCLEVCPTGALTPNGAAIAIDPHICAGCGSCAAACPSGALAYQLPTAELVFQRLRTLLSTYRERGGKDPVLLIHDGDGYEPLAAAARFGRGLPANVLPFAVNEVMQLGFDHMAVALAYGVRSIAFLVQRDKRGETAGLRIQIGMLDALCDGLGYGGGRVTLIEAEDPDAISDLLYGTAPAIAVQAADFLPMGRRREVAGMALTHLHANAPIQADVVAMPAGSPFGTVEMRSDGCTLCMSCVATCPANALRSNSERPQLSFVEQACIQCGLCRATCPEGVLGLVPRLSFAAEARAQVILKEEDPAICTCCGKAFGVSSMIERMATVLADKHPMFMGEAAKRLRMCEDCRVSAQFSDVNPMGAGPAHRPRTTADDLRERQQAGT